MSNFIEKTKFLIGQGESDFYTILSQNRFDVLDYDSFFFRYESNITNYHLLKLKFLINSKNDIKEIIKTVITEMENVYQIPIEFTIRLSDSTSTFKKGDFGNFLRAKIIVHYSVNPVNMYVFQQNPYYFQYLKDIKENNLEQRDIDELNHFLGAILKCNEPKLRIEGGQIFQKLQSRNVNKDQIINYLKTFIADLMIKHQNVLNSNNKKMVSF